MLRKLFALFLLIFLNTSCNSLRDSSKYEFESARYYTSIIPSADTRMYIDVEEDTISIHSYMDEGVEKVNSEREGYFSPDGSTYTGKSTFYNPSFDFDIITIPLKYRFERTGLPNQLTTNFNGNIYLGYRSDLYSINYKTSPIQEVERSISHFGFSLGGFLGISSEPVNPWVTREAVEAEYDGAVFSAGAAWIMGFNNLSAGIALGYDHLLDSNRKQWIYQGKPWLGLAFGISLN